MFKFEIGQLIWYMLNGKIHNARVLSRMYVENAHDDWIATEQQREAFTPFGLTRVVYSTCHGILPEHEIHERQESLVLNLLTV